MERSKRQYFFWKNFTKTLRSWGFHINSFDWFIANKTVRGKQLTVVRHVDDMKISHMDNQVVTAMIDALNMRYG